MWQTGWKGSLGKNGSMYMYAWGLSLSTWNYHNIVNQLCFDTKYKVKIHKWDRENLCWWNWSRICLEHHQSETSECNLLFLLIWGKWPTKGAEETDAQFWGPEMFPCIVAKLSLLKTEALVKIKEVQRCLSPPALRFPMHSGPLNHF